MKKPKPLELDGLMNYAAQALSARAQSLNEMHNRLKRRAVKQEDVAEVLSLLKQAGMLDDNRFADSFANWRRENQGLGKARVVRDLMVRRVAPAVAKKAVDQAYAEVDETGLIESFLARKYRGKNLGELLQEPKNLASAYRKLRLAGFSSGNSIGALKRYAAEADRLADIDDEIEQE